MKNFLMAAATVMLISAPVLADDHNSAVGNTLRVTSGEGSWDTWLHADGTFSDSRGLSGTWSLADQLCFDAMTEQGPVQTCGPWNESMAVGDVWVTNGWTEDGSDMTVELVAGQ